MPVYELDFNDMETSAYTLIGIHTTLTDHKIAYLLNVTLGTLFKKANYCLDITKNKNTTSYAVFEYFNSEYHAFLIGNIHKHNKTANGISLFSENTLYSYLIPEQKKVDYFLKIEGDMENDFILDTIHKINQISQIVTSYKIEVDSLKSKDFLIF